MEKRLFFERGRGYSSGGEEAVLRARKSRFPEVELSVKIEI
jgi:hypothetical protein